MRNIIISIALFLFMMLAIFISLSYLSSTCDKITSAADKLEEIINEEEWDEAYKASLELDKTWDKYSSVVCIFVHHQEIDNISGEIWKLTQYTKEGTKDEALASVHMVKLFIKHVETLEKVSIQNIL